MSVQAHETVAERLEAEARVTMARIAKMEARGFDTAKAKADEVAFLDALLDQINDLNR